MLVWSHCDHTREPAKEVKVRKVGVREFRDNATKLLSAGETMLIERHGHPVGYFIPVKRKDTAETEAALSQLADAVEQALREGDLSEDDLANLFTLGR